MIVAAESNFVLQLALEQEEGVAARSILALAEGGRVRLVIPACALFEPYGTLVRRHIKRGRVLAELRREISELARSNAFSSIGDRSSSVTGIIAGSAAVEASALDDTIDRIARVATIIPLTNEIVTAATDFRRLIDEFSPPDSIVFASIDRYLQSQDSQPKVFTTTDTKGFMNAAVRGHLVNYNCRVIPSFADTLGYIQNQLAESVEGSRGQAR